LKSKNMTILRKHLILNESLLLALVVINDLVFYSYGI